MGIKICYYHANNGIFKANGWVQDCIDKQQSLTYSGVNAHHQNGIAERRIRELQDLTRTMLIHANRRWPKSIETNLWPYALRMANDAINATPNMQHKLKNSLKVGVLRNFRGSFCEQTSIMDTKKNIEHTELSDVSPCPFVADSIMTSLA